MKAGILPCLPVVIAPFALVSPVWLTGKALFWGVVSLQFVPWRYYAWEIIRSGHLPLWNPLNGMGAPLLANYQSALLYPPNWFIFLMQGLGGIGWAAWGEAILAAAHLAWAGLGMVFLSRRLGVRELGQTVSGLAFGLSGYLVARLGFLSINAAVSWLPWVILATEGFSGPPSGQETQSGVSQEFPGQSLLARIWRVRWLSLCFALQLLAGHAQTAWYTLLLAFCWGSMRVWTRIILPEGAYRTMGRWTDIKLRLRQVISMWGQLALASALAVGLASVQLLPTAEYLYLSQRSSQVDFDLAMTYSFWPWRFLTILAPDMFGNPARGDFWGYGNYWEDALYLGLLPVLLALAALVKGKPYTRFLFGLSIISILLALGKNTPVFPWLYHNIPTFSLFQAPTRISIWFVFGLALMAGIGVNAWRRPVGRGLYWTRLATAGALAVTLGAGLAWYFLSEIQLTFLRATALAGMWGVGTGLLALLAPEDGMDSSRGKIIHRAWPGMVVLHVVADLLVAGWGLNPGIDLSFYRQSGSMVVQIREMLGDGRIYLPAEVDEELKFDRYMRFDTFSPTSPWQTLRQVLLPNVNLLDALPSVNNFDPIVMGDYDRWMAALAEVKGSVRADLLNLMAVRAVEDMDSRQENGVRFSSFEPGKRFRWVPCARSALNAEGALEILLSGEIDVDRQAVIGIESESAEADPQCDAPISTAHIKVISDNPNRVEVEVNAENAGWLVVSDTIYPGWRATIDGEEVPIRVANSLFRAVYIVPGAQTVIFSYYPNSFYAGIMISLLAIIFLGVAYRRRR